MKGPQTTVRVLDLSQNAVCCGGPDGRPEPFAVEHAWNADTLLSNSLLANLQRHSDHHVHAWKPYPELEPLPGPQLPTGYASMILLAYLPWLWLKQGGSAWLLLPGAASLALWDKAEDAARKALDVGSRRHEARIRLTAEALIESVRHHRVLEARKRAAQPEPVAAAEAQFAEELVRSLQIAG